MDPTSGLALLGVAHIQITGHAGDCTRSRMRGLLRALVSGLHCMGNHNGYQVAPEHRHESKKRRNRSQCIDVT
jgi:hypothetical protein